MICLRKNKRYCRQPFGVGLSWGYNLFSTDLRYLSLIEYEGKL